MTFGAKSSAGGAAPAARWHGRAAPEPAVREGSQVGADELQRVDPFQSGPVLARVLRHAIGQSALAVLYAVAIIVLWFLSAGSAAVFVYQGF